MHAAGPRALRSPAAATVASSLASTCRRNFHQSRPSRKSPTDGSGSAADGGKPPSKTEAEQRDPTNKRDGTSSSASSESAAKRTRGSPFATSRQRQVRTRVAEELPPVALPQSFADSNITTWTDAERIATLRKDPIWHPGSVGALWHDWLQLDLVLAFEAASWENEEALKQTIADLEDGKIDMVSRRVDMVGCLASYLKMCLKLKWSQHEDHPTSKPEDLRSDKLPDAKGDEASKVVSKILGPIQRHSSYGQPKCTKESWQASRNHVEALYNRIRHYILHGVEDKENETLAEKKNAEDLESLDAYFIESHRTRIFDSNLLGELATSLRAELSLLAQEKWDRKELKRPVIIVNVTDYSGSYPTSRLLYRMAAQVDATLLRLDAQDLAGIVGGYLGQDTAYAKGSVSMLAYKVAELNGRLLKGPEAAPTSEEEMSGEIETAWVNFRQQSTNGSFKSPMEEELQKIKDGARDYVLPSVDRWENLKINVALEQMITTAAKKSSDPDQPLIVQLDNFVELSMTLEGALLIGRLRGIIDSMWKEGKKIVLVGTSANRDPPEQFVSALKEISAEENVFDFSVRRGDIEGVEAKLARREVLDYVYENLRNVQIMLRSIAGELGTDFESPVPQLDDVPADKVKDVETRISSTFIHAVMRELTDPSVNIDHYPSYFTNSIMPNPDVYHVARVMYGSSFGGDATLISLLEHFFRAIKSKLISTSSGHADLKEDKQTSQNSQSANKQKAEPERVGSGGKYNDIEKKLLAGLVDVNEIKTTFADVHAPKDTIAALKLLTSLSLARPDAFTYGILAKDKIPGCLLYGPPGTGKTLLAKAVAKESGASMLEVSGASINDMYVGQSEKNVRALFSLAKKLSPLVIFIDEADALFAARSQSRSRPSHRETINQFLREWDGMSDMKAFIMVATNRPFDLDDAVLRRLPRKILVDLPTQTDRAAILKILLKDEQLEDAVNIEELSKQTVLYSGSDLKNLCVAAAMSAVQEEMEDATRHEGPEPYVYPERRTIGKRHFDKAAKEIAASISEDMDSLKSIRKFDQKYGDQRAKRSKPRGMGFGVVTGATDAEDARVRQPTPE